VNSGSEAKRVGDRYGKGRYRTARHNASEVAIWQYPNMCIRYQFRIRFDGRRTWSTWTTPIFFTSDGADEEVPEEKYGAIRHGG